MKNTIYVLGNPIVPEDNLPVKLMKKLKALNPSFEFALFDPTESIVPENDSKLVFLDTVIGIKKVKKFTDIENFILSPRFSVHDYDFMLFIKLLKKLGKVNQVAIIGVPVNGKESDMIKEVTSILKSI